MMEKMKLQFPEFDEIKNKVFDRIAEKYGEFDKTKVRVKKEDVGYENGFGYGQKPGFICRYEIIIDSELFYVKLWGDYEYYLYSLYMLMECESSDQY